MTAKHRIASTLFGLVIGLVVAGFSYHWITDEGKRIERAEEEQVVLRARGILLHRLGLVDPEYVDPLSPQRRVGKVYIYPTQAGWEVSGYYRRDQDDRWHPYLMSLNSTLELQALKVQDSALAGEAANDPLLELTG